MSRTRRRGEEFSPPCTVDVEIERGGGENPLLAPQMSRTRRGGESSPLLAPRMSKTRDEEGTHPSSRRCQLQLLPSLRRRRQLGGMGSGVMWQRSHV